MEFAATPRNTPVRTCCSSHYYSRPPIGGTQRREGTPVRGSTHGHIADLVADALRLNDHLRARLVEASEAPEEAADSPNAHHTIERTDYVRAHATEARGCYLRGESERAVGNLGYALHFLADTLVPAPVSTGEEHTRFEQDCADAAERLSHIADKPPVGPGQVLDHVCEQIRGTGSKLAPDAAYETAARWCTWLAAAVFCPAVEPGAAGQMERLRARFKQKLKERRRPLLTEANTEIAQIEADRKKGRLDVERHFAPDRATCWAKLQVIDGRISEATLARARELREGPPRRRSRQELEASVGRTAIWLPPAIAMPAAGAWAGFAIGAAQEPLLSLIYTIVGAFIGLIPALLLWVFRLEASALIARFLDRLVNGRYHRYRRRTEDAWQPVLNYFHRLRRETAQASEWLEGDRQAALADVAQAHDARRQEVERRVAEVLDGIKQDYLQRAEQVRAEADQTWYRRPEVGELA